MNVPKSVASQSKRQKNTPKKKKKKRKENCTGRYSRGLMNQNGEHLMNLYELNILEINTKSFLYVCIAYDRCGKPEPLKIQIT